MIIPANLKQYISEIQKSIEKEEIELNPEFYLNHIWIELMQKCITENMGNYDIDINKSKENYNNDYLGEIYEFFFRNMLVWHNNKLIIKEISSKKRELGKIYTPFEIIFLIIRIIQYELGNNLKLNVDFLKVADIACGTGRFLFEFYYQEEKFKFKKNYKNIHYYGYDIDDKAISLAKISNNPNFTWKSSDSLFDPELNKTNQFHLIVGNPPYIESRSIEDNYWNELKQKYKNAYKKFDLSIIFIEKIINLLKPNGIAGLIITNKWMSSEYGKKIRKYLLTRTKILFIIDVSQFPSFQKISTYPVIIIFQKLAIKENIANHQIYIANLQNHNEFNKLVQWEKISLNYFSQISQKYFIDLPDSIISTQINNTSSKIFDKVLNLKKTEKVFFFGDKDSPYELRKGIHTGNIRDKIFLSKFSKKNTHIKKAVTSRNKIEKYLISWNNLWINYNPAIIDRNKGEYASFRENWIFETNPKILIKLFGTEIQAALDNCRFYANNSLILLFRKRTFYLQENYMKNFLSESEDMYYLLGVLNSKFISDYYKFFYSNTHVRGNYMQFYIKDLRNIPIIKPNKKNIKIIRSISKLACEIQETATLEKKIPQNIEMKINDLVEKLFDFV